MFSNKSKEITKKRVPEVKAISTTFLDPFVEKREDLFFAIPRRVRDPSLFG